MSEYQIKPAVSTCCRSLYTLNGKGSYICGKCDQPCEIQECSPDDPGATFARYATKAPIPDCDICFLPQRKLGALLFSPPENHNKPTRLHVCKDCYARSFDFRFVGKEKEKIAEVKARHRCKDSPRWRGTNWSYKFTPSPIGSNITMHCECCGFMEDITFEDKF